MNITTLWLTALPAMGGLALVAWAVSTARRNVGLVDIFWSLFLLQGLLMWVISMPVLAAQSADEPDNLTAVDVAGTAVWAIGFFFEAVGDWQLARFKADPANAGRVMDRGLWRYSRHPNYFGEFCVWWGLYAIALGAGAWWSVFSPLLMTVLLLRVSGVKLLEKDIGERRPAYRDYIARTNAFFPSCPKDG